MIIWLKNKNFCGSFTIEEMMVFSATDRILFANDRILFANDRILFAYDRFCSARIVYFQLCYFTWLFTFPPNSNGMIWCFPAKKKQICHDLVWLLRLLLGYQLKYFQKYWIWVSPLLSLGELMMVALFVLLLSELNRKNYSDFFFFGIQNWPIRWFHFDKILNDFLRTWLIRSVPLPVFEPDYPYRSVL